MNRSFYFRLLLATALTFALAATPQSSFAQRGGFHGGGGGFHGGGGGGFHGGGSAFRGGGFGASRGGFGAFRGGRGFGGFGGRGFGGFRGGRFGGFRGYPGFYSGFGFGLGWPYWGAYPYWYGYSPYWGGGLYAYYDPYGYGYGYGYGYDPYDYPYDEPSRDYNRPPSDGHSRDNDRCRDYRHDCSPPAKDNDKPNGPAKPSNGSAGDSSAAGSYMTVHFSGTSEALRPAVRNAMAALRAMPPAARERQLNSGRYAGFSAEERALLSQAADQLRQTYN